MTKGKTRILRVASWVCKMTGTCIWQISLGADSGSPEGCPALKVNPVCCIIIKPRRRFQVHSHQCQTLCQAPRGACRHGLCSELVSKILETKQTINQLKINKYDYYVSFVKYLVEIWHVSSTLSHPWNSPMISIVSYQLFNVINHIFIHSFIHTFIQQIY